MGAEKWAWLDQGLTLLAEQGAPAVTLDRLCERMGMSKGAFYHHFGSMPKYRIRLLDHFEAKCTTAIINGVEASDTLPARERLARLLAEVTKDAGPPLEIAMRAWAKQDPEAARVQERVDATRIGYLRDLCEQAGHGRPDQVAKMLYLMLVGAEHLTPPLPKPELRGMYELLMPLLDRLAS
ncbi:TetR/AcrR family transcriptional regulator [Streptomyces sp. NPDC048191]|uniref:TetR/AcrR family transcriptional regulator n=1 Tax=Streptomyces sp. NPDC048191 TaxID=3155484 RepID=UPI0033F44594